MNPPTPSRTPWSFSVANWELGDTLGDLVVGQRLEAALMFWEAELHRHRRTQEVTARRVEWNHYAVTGEVVFSGVNSWVLDIGLPVVSKGHWPHVEPGVVVSGDVWLSSLTAGMWGEDLFASPAPPLDCVWEVERIWLNAIPWIETSPGIWGRAETAASFTELERTDHATDDNGRGDYVLDCRLLNSPSTSSQSSSPGPSPKPTGTISEVKEAAPSAPGARGVSLVVYGAHCM